MLNEYVALFPEIIITIGILLMGLIKLFNRDATPKTFYNLSRFFMIFGLFAAAVFYNQNVGAYLYNNMFTILFKILIYAFTFVWSYLSFKHFAGKNVSGFAFYETLLFNLLGFSIAISAHNLLLLFIGLSSQFLANNVLLRIEKNNNDNFYVRSFLWLSLFFTAVFGLGIAIMYYYTRTFDYDAIERILAVRSQIIWQYQMAFICVMVALLFMLGVAPLHFWYAGIVSKSILPVGGYLTIVPIFAYFACLVNVCVNAFYPLLGWFNLVFIVFGLLSILFGAIGANSEINVRKIFAYSGLYYIGVTILTLFPLTDQNLVAAFTYLLVYVVAMCGIYTVFYGYRSKGVYMSELDDIKGVATQRPFLSAALLIFMISLIGTPPLLGFLGKLSVINSLVIGHHFVLIGVELLTMLVLVYAYLKIIMAIYFDHRYNIFDTVDKGVYICLLINIILILFAIINPKYLMHDVELMLVEVF